MEGGSGAAADGDRGQGGLKMGGKMNTLNAKI